MHPPSSSGLCCADMSLALASELGEGDECNLQKKEASDARERRDEGGRGEGGAADRLEMRKAHTTKEFMKKGLDLIVGVMSSRDHTA
jgi:hypothetical protein